MKGDILVIEDGVVKVGGSSMATIPGLEELKEENKQLKEQLVKKDKEIIEFIEELAWFDAQYDAMQSTMGDMSASRSAIPRYAKKYFNLWKELFNENLEQNGV